MRIRDATPADAEAVRRVHADSIEGLGPEAYSQEQVEAWALGCESADYDAAIRQTDAFLVAERDGEVVGFGSLDLEPSEQDYESSPDAEITGVYVHPSVVREGVGTALYGELEERARVADVDTLGLLASRNAVSFYEAMGYERVAEHDHEFSSHESTGVTGTVVELAVDL